MSKKRKDNTEETEIETMPVRRERPPRNIIASEATMSFKAWFINKLNSDPRLKPHHFDQLLIYMRGLGIKEEDAPTRFENGLNTYFGK